MLWVLQCFQCSPEAVQGPVRLPAAEQGPTALLMWCAGAGPDWRAWHGGGMLSAPLLRKKWSWGPLLLLFTGQPLSPAPLGIPSPVSFWDTMV